MKIEANNVEEYLKNLPEERKDPINKIREILKSKLPAGFKETLNYGMIGYVVPHTIYPDGYHCDPKLPLPFVSLASQKNYIALYHSGIYANKDLSDWFIKEYKKETGKKPDMGKSCIRFKKTDKIPYKLLEELCGKITPQEWIKTYESKIKR